MIVFNNTFIFIFLVSGSIELLDYEMPDIKSWPVYSDCKSVRMRSSLFQISDDEYVKIGKTQYTDRTKIDTILSSNFTVAFQLSKSTKKKVPVLNWTCLKLGDWTPTGTCTEVNSLQPEYNGPNIKYRTQYRKTNETCSK